MAGPARAPARADTRIALVAAVLLLIGMPIGYLGDNTSTGDVIGLIVLTLVMLGLLAAIFRWLVPRALGAAEGVNGPARTGLLLGVLALVTVVVFWTGLPFPLGAGAVALGLAGRELAPLAGDGGRATVAVVLGALALLLAFVGLLVG
jgi:hypothetical protein